jgi:hypothetical protein
MTTKKATTAKKLETLEFTCVEDFKAWRASLPPAEQNSKAVTAAAEKLIVTLQKG